MVVNMRLDVARSHILSAKRKNERVLVSMVYPKALLCQTSWREASMWSIIIFKSLLLSTPPCLMLLLKGISNSNPSNVILAERLVISNNTAAIKLG